MASMLFVFAVLLMVASFLSPLAQAADGACQAVVDVGRKVLTTPTHIYTTRTNAFRSGGKPTTVDVGGKLGKSHSSMRYEYGNVEPPRSE